MPCMNNLAAYEIIISHPGNTKATNFLKNSATLGIKRSTAYVEALDILATQLGTIRRHILPAPKHEIRHSLNILLNMAEKGIPLAEAPLRVKAVTMHPLFTKDTYDFNRSRHNAFFASINSSVDQQLPSTMRSQQKLGPHQDETEKTACAMTMDTH